MNNAVMPNSARKVQLKSDSRLEGPESAKISKQRAHAHEAASKTCVRHRAAVALSIESASAARAV